MNQQAISLESIHDALPAKCQKVLLQVRKLAAVTKTDEIHLTMQQHRELREAIEKVRERDKVERQVEMRYAGKRLVRWDDPLADSA